jgi:hypothetical protein
MNPIDSYDLQVVQQLEKLKGAPPRDPQRAAAGRAAFLQEAREMAQTVSIPSEIRPTGWKQKLQTMFSTRKERSPMFTGLTTVILALMLIFGGGGITLASAQNSLPDQPLYNLKLWSEELRFNLTADPQAAWQLALSFANRRASEVQAMFAAGQTPSQAVQERYQSQVEQAIRRAAGLPGDQALRALEQTRQQLRLQEQALNQIQIQNNPQAEMVRERLRYMLQERLNWVEAGIERQQHRNGSPAQGPVPATATAEPTDNVTPSGALPAGAATHDAGNPWTTGAPTPGSGYGPGPGDGACETCTPAGGNNPWTTGTPTPGGSYGPGPDPTQSGSNNGGETQPTQSPANTQTPKSTQGGPGHKGNPTPDQPQSTQNDPGPQKTPGGGKNGG